MSAKPSAEQPVEARFAPSLDANGDQVLELEIPPRRDYLAVARQLVAAVNVDARLDPLRLSNLQLAVSEACTNAIAAHELNGVSDVIAIRAAASPARVEVVIRDQGGGFDPGQAVALPDPEDPRRLEYETGLSHRAIAQACAMGLGTVTTYLQRAAAAGLSWPDGQIRARPGGNPLPR